MRTLIINLSILGSVFLTACEKTVILDTEQVPSKLVIDAHLTDELKFHTVNLSESVDFYFDERPPAVEQAVVTITDTNTGTIYTFVNADEDLFDPGTYISTEAFRGEVGHTYTLEVIYNDDIYEASETMLPVSPIDSLTTRISLQEQEDPDEEGYFYEVLLFAKEPQNTEDYYYFKFYRNDTLTFDSETSIYFTDDKFLGERIANLPAPIFFKEGDQATVEIYSVTREAYIYLNDLFNILNNDSGMFSPPPANPRNNISNGGLGYFLVSSISRETISIQ